MRKTNNCAYFSCYLFCKLSEIIVENVSITLLWVTTEWLLIFLPYIHLNDHCFSVFFTKKKIVRVFCTHTFTKTLPWTPWGREGYSPVNRLMLTYCETIIFPVGIYLFKVNNKNTRKRCETCPKLIKKTPEYPKLT